MDFIAVVAEIPAGPSWMFLRWGWKGISGWSWKPLAQVQDGDSAAGAGQWPSAEANPSLAGDQAVERAQTNKMHVLPAHIVDADLGNGDGQWKRQMRLRPEQSRWADNEDSDKR